MKKSIGPHTILYPHPVLLVGTWAEDGRANLATVSWGGICCSRPPCVAISLRAATMTHGNIVRRQAFTVSVPSEDRVREADYAGIVSGRDVAKFEAMGLTEVRSEKVDAPYPDEMPFVLECRVLKTVEIGLHTQFVGEILDVKADESILGPEGMPDPGKVRPFWYATGTRTYYSSGGPIGKAFTTKEF
jgi:flavin reductase (DIM6/NTAB) family NADH-FMN oxidoreductase RutF